MAAELLRRFVDSDDIGLCDGCGTEEGTREKVTVERTLVGERVDMAEWLCSACTTVEVPL